MNTITAALARAAADPKSGIHLVGLPNERERLSYQRLYEQAQRAAVGLLEKGCRPGDVVLLTLPTGEAFLTLFFGCLLAGVVPCPFSPPQGRHLGPWGQRLGRISAMLGARATILPPEVAEAAPDLTESLGAWSPATLLSARGAPPEHQPAPEDLAFIQLTSGTTALPKGVCLSHGAVSFNVQQIYQGSGMHREDVVVSWLPLFHDMGLIGGVLTPLFGGMDLALSNPFHFLRRPESWLRMVHQFGGTHSPAPTFAYGYVVQRLRGQLKEPLDLSTWRVAFVGAEPIQADLLAAFEAGLAPYGLSPRTLLPCYGIAEASLAVTFKPHAEPHRTLALSRSVLARSGQIEAANGTDDAQVLVSCGAPLPGTTVRILGPEGDELPGDRLGEIFISGPSLFSHYHGRPPRGEVPFATGDLGFLHDGELYVVGRSKEVMILGGENVHPAEVEWAAGQAEGVREGRVAAFGVTAPELGTEQLCLLAELAARQADPRQVAAAVRRQVREATGLVVERIELVRSGTIPVTTSGKIQRVRARDILLAMEAESTSDP